MLLKVCSTTIAVTVRRLYEQTLFRGEYSMIMGTSDPYKLQNENASKVAWPLRKDNDSDEWETKPKSYATN